MSWCGWVCREVEDPLFFEPPSCSLPVKGALIEIVKVVFGFADFHRGWRKELRDTGPRFLLLVRLFWTSHRNDHRTR